MNGNDYLLVDISGVHVENISTVMNSYKDVLNDYSNGLLESVDYKPVEYWGEM